MNELLEDPTGLAYLVMFSANMLCVENVLFIMDFRQLRDKADSVDANQRRKWIKKLFYKYMTPYSLYDLNVDSQVRHQVKFKVLKEETDDVEVFAEVERAVLLILRQDIYPRFLASKECSQLVEELRLMGEEEIGDRLTL